MIEEEFENEETQAIEKSLNEGQPVEIRRQPANREIRVVREEGVEREVDEEGTEEQPVDTE